MANARIILPVEGDLSEEEERLLRLTMLDAFHMFYVSRERYGGVAGYVDKAYPVGGHGGEGGVYDDPEERAAKVARVERRIALAKRLHVAAFAFKIEEE